jgi:hypothetical protein
MRKELELIEQIERYLQGGLSAAEKKLFEQEMAGDASLREAVALQKEVMQGIERAALKQHIQAARGRYNSIRRITRWGLPGIGMMIVIAALFYYGRQHHWSGLHVGGTDVETAGGLAGPDKNIAAQVFFIDAAKDTVIETKGGMVLSVPANGFLDDGRPVQGRVALTVREALDAAAIMKAGLSTTSGGGLLETGGIFSIDAHKDGNALQVNPAAGIYAGLPAPALKPAGMQLYSGKRLPDGTIDWVNPVPLEHTLTPVDITTLDFYPPHYVDSVAGWGYNARDKKFTDSLYYSLAVVFAKEPVSVDTKQITVAYSPLIDTAAPSTTEAPGQSPGYKKPEQNDLLPAETTAVQDSSYPKDATAGDQFFHSPYCLINPAKIKTIWNPHFQNTLLSTREFQQRLVWLHAAAVHNDGNAVLDLYISHLDKNLSDIDSMAARLLTGEYRERFLLFAAQHDGKVKNGIKQLDKLRAYYQSKSLAYTAAIAKTQNEFWQKQAELDGIADKKKAAHEQKDRERLNQNFEQELELNLKEACRQLGYDTTIRPRPVPTSVYTVRIVSTGWYNIDKAVYESTLDRKTLNYTDPQTGKKAVINYRPVSFSITDAREYDRLYVYLLPDKLNSFMRLPATADKYTGQLDELMQYKMVCIGWKEEQAFFYSLDNVQPGDYSPVALTAIDKARLDETLNRLGNGAQAIDIKEETSYFLFEARDEKRQKRNKEILVLWYKLIRFLIPCENILK